MDSNCGAFTIKHFLHCLFRTGLKQGGKSSQIMQAIPLFGKCENIYSSQDICVASNSDKN